MSKLPPITRLAKEDFAEYPWAEKLLWPINRVFEQLYGALNRDITAHENLRAQIKTISFETTNPVEGTYPLKFLPDPDIKGVTASDVILTKIARQDGTALASGATIEWGLASDGQIQITNITGLIASTAYIIRLIVLFEGV
jgi:hypothetical protein